MKKQNNLKKFGDILSRFRNDVVEFSEKFGGLTAKKSNFKASISRKEKRKLERQLKHAKKLAFSKKEKPPTLETFIKSKQKNKKDTKEPKEPNVKNPKEEKPTENKASNKNLKTDKNLNSIEIIENRLSKEVKERKKYENSFKDSIKRKLIEDNEREEKEIRKLEKLLHIKKDSKKYKKAFYEEGYDDLLDFCDEEKRKEMLNEETNLWLDSSYESKDKSDENSKKKKAKIEKLNKDLKKTEESDNSDQSDISENDLSDGEEDEHNNDFFIKSKNDKTNKKVKFKNVAEIEEDELENESQNDEDDENEHDDEDDQEDDAFDGEEDEEAIEDDDEDGSIEDEDEDEDEDESEHDEELDKQLMQDEKEKKELAKKGIKEDIYGRLVDKKGNVVKTEKYVPPAQRLKQLLDQSSNAKNEKLVKLSKQINGLLNRLSTTNIISILNQIVQMFYSNQFTRFDLMDTLYKLIDNSLIKQMCLTPTRLIIEHAALVSALTTSIGVELGANLLQRLCQKLDNDLKQENFYSIENKTLDNLILFLCNLYNFKLFSSNLIIDLLNDHLIESLNFNDKNDLTKIEKSVDIILLILRSIGFALRKDNPVDLKDLIIKLQTKINLIKSKFDSLNTTDADSVNNRLKFMLESINAIKNNDIRRLDAFDQAPIDQIKKQMKNNFKDDQILLNITYKDLISANELGRWWIVGSAWNLKENKDNEGEQKDDEILTKDSNKSVSNGAFSEKILQLAKEQHMNTDIRKAIFCIIVSAEDYTDSFIKLVKLSLKKQQEREIIYVILHCALNEKKHNPYYSFLMQKFCEYDRRFKMTLQFHTWDKFKLLTSMTKQQISNFASMYTHLIGTAAMSLSVLKNADFGEMNKSMLQFLRELFTNLFTKYNFEQLQEIFLRIANVKKLYQLRNAIKLFIYHFMLTDKGKDVSLDEKLKEKCQFAEKILSLNSND